MSRATLQERLKLLCILHIKELTTRKKTMMQESLENSSTAKESGKCVVYKLTVYKKLLGNMVQRWRTLSAN